MKSGLKQFWIGGGLAALASACASTAVEPPSPPAAFAASPASPTAGQEPDDAWVDSFGNAELARLVAEALAANPELEAIEQRAIAARSRAVAGGGSWLPDLNITFDTSRTESPIAGSDRRARRDVTTSLLSSSWEADLWGRAFDGVRAGYADARAASAEFNGARLSVAGQTARAWIGLVESRQLAALAAEDLATRTRALEITQRRYAAGLANALAVRTARSQVASARAAQAAQEDELLAAARRLETVLGRYPAAAMSTEAEPPPLAPLTAPGAPTELLARRPDIAAAEARLRAAGLRADQARKALLPRLTISLTAAGSAEGAAGGLRDVTDVDGLVTQVLGGLTAPLFNGGALRAQAAAARADARAAAANYVQDAIAAWGEVEGALAADRTFAVRENALAAAAEDAREAQKLAEREYAGGVATIFELIDAYSRRIDAERGLIQTRTARFANRVNYHVALGGGAATGGLRPTSPAEHSR